MMEAMSMLLVPVKGCDDAAVARCPAAPAAPGFEGQLAAALDGGAPGPGPSRAPAAGDRGGGKTGGNSAAREGGHRGAAGDMAGPGAHAAPARPGAEAEKRREPDTPDAAAGIPDAGTADAWLVAMPVRPFPGREAPGQTAGAPVVSPAGAWSTAGQAVAAAVGALGVGPATAAMGPAAVAGFSTAAAGVSEPEGGGYSAAAAAGISAAAGGGFSGPGGAGISEAAAAGFSGATGAEQAAGVGGTTSGGAAATDRDGADLQPGQPGGTAVTGALPAAAGGLGRVALSGMTAVAPQAAKAPGGATAGVPDRSTNIPVGTDTPSRLQPLRGEAVPAAGRAAVALRVLLSGDAAAGTGNVLGQSQAPGTSGAVSVPAAGALPPGAAAQPDGTGSVRGLAAAADGHVTAADTAGSHGGTPARTGEKADSPGAAETVSGPATLTAGTGAASPLRADAVQGGSPHGGSQGHPGEAAQPREVVAQIARQAELSQTAGRTHLRVQLQPEHLGQVTLRVSLESGGALHGSVTVSHPGVREALEQALPELRQTLADRGLRVESFSVQVGSDGGRRPPQEAPHRPQRPIQQHVQGEAQPAVRGVDPQPGRGSRYLNALA